MEQIGVLDHGFVRLVETWGRGDVGIAEAGIIEAARQSTQKSFLGWGPRSVRVPSILPSGGKTIEQQPGDEKLLKYLYENQHSTPFEFAGMVIEVRAPIFVFREWHRHRTQSYNEMSARYAPLPDLNYIPTVERLMMNSKANKQAGTIAGAEEMTTEKAEWFQDALRDSYGVAQRLYEDALQNGVPKELARVHLPVGRYSQMRASTCLRNWLSFMTLRSDKNPGAQWEIRQFANAVGKILSKEFPQTMKLFSKGSE